MMSQLDGGAMGPLQPEGGGNVRLPPATALYPTQEQTARCPRDPVLSWYQCDRPAPGTRPAIKVLQWRLQ